MAETLSMPDEKTIEQYLEAAVSIAEATGPIALGYFRKPLKIDNKAAGQKSGPSFDPVTRADREIEAAIRAELGRRFPDHGIVGEEEAAVVSDSAYQWIIDPIDGTRAFISGVPAWGILLGLTMNQTCLAGVMHQPYLGETFMGVPGRASMRRDGKETVLRTSDTSDVGSAVLYCTHPSMFPDPKVADRFERVASASRMMRFGGDCYSYCLLAHGLIDLVVEAGLQPYDIVPLIAIVEGAGGIVTNWQGESAMAGGRVIAAANASLHQQALDLLNS
jgi:myo-inositol-1(or 4)-monophosphatase